MSRFAATLRAAKGLLGATNEIQHRWIARAFALSLVALLLGALSPVVARASCGDYVMIGGQHPAHAAQQSPAGSQSQHSLPMNPVKPCNGPNCSRAPLSAPVPVPTVNSNSQEQWACGAAADSVTESQFSAVLDGERVAPGPGYPESIDHPPR